MIHRHYKIKAMIDSNTVYMLNAFFPATGKHSMKTVVPNDTDFAQLIFTNPRHDGHGSLS